MKGFWPGGGGAEAQRTAGGTDADWKSRIKGAHNVETEHNLVGT